MAAAHSWRRRRGAASPPVTSEGTLRSSARGRARRRPTASICDQRARERERAVDAIDAALDEGGAQGRRPAQGGKPPPTPRRWRTGPTSFSNLYRARTAPPRSRSRTGRTAARSSRSRCRRNSGPRRPRSRRGLQKGARLRRGSAVVEELLEASSAKSTVLEGLRGDAVDADGDALEMLERSARRRRARLS